MKACVNTNNPEYKKLLEETKDPLAAELEFDRIQDANDYLAKPETTLEEDINKRYPDNDIKELGFEAYDLNKQNQSWANEAVTKIADEFSKKMGIEYAVISEETAFDMLENTQTKYDREPAFFFAGKVFLVQGRLSPESTVHEFIHPVIKSISKTQPELLNNLYNQIASTKEGVELINSVSANYDITDERLKEEIIVRAIQKDVLMSLQNTEKSTGFVNAIKNILFTIKQALRNVFGSKVKVEKLKSNTSLKELADLIAGENFQLDSQIISHEDFAEFAKDMKDFLKEVDKIKDFKGLQAKIDNFHSLISSNVSSVKGRNKNLAGFKDEMYNLEGIQGKLTPYTSRAQSDTNKDYTSDEYHYKQATAFIGSLTGLDVTIDKVASKINELQNKQNYLQDDVLEIMAYQTMITGWKKTMLELKKDIEDSGMENELRTITAYLSELDGRINTNNRKLNELKAKSAGDWVTNSAQDMSNVIEEWNKIRLDQLTKTGATERVINNHKAEYEKYKIDKEKVAKILKGEGGDLNFMNAMFESYTNIHDPVIGSFANFLRNQMSEVEATLLNKTNTFMKELDPIITKAGYVPAKADEFNKRISFVEKVGKYNPQTGEVDITEVLSFLNPHSGVRLALAEWEKKIEDVRKLDDGKALQEVLEEERQFIKDNFISPYSEAFNVFEEKYQNDPFGKVLFEKRKEIMAQVSELSDWRKTAIEKNDNYDQITKLWREYNQLMSLTNLDGTPKTGINLKEAEFLREYREASKNFYTFEEKEGAFESALDSFENDLIGKGLQPGSEEFKAEREKWLKRNTVIKYTDEWYKAKKQAIDTIKSVTGKFKEELRNKLDITANWDKILSSVSGYKDNEGQPIATDMSPERLANIKKYQDEITAANEILAAASGMTVAQLNRFQQLMDIKQAKGLSEAEQDEYELLIDIGSENEQMMNSAEKLALIDAYRTLNAIQERVPTSYYLQRMQEWLDKHPELKFDTVDETNADLLLSPVTINPLLNKNKEFKEWFLKNHIIKQVYDVQTDSYVPKYERLYVWSVTRPTTDQFYEKFTLKNKKDEFGQPEVILGQPSMAYFKRVKRERTLDTNELIETKKEIGVTTDAWGRWLPKPGNKLFANQEYERVKQEEPDLFNALNVITKYHIDHQKSIPMRSRLGYDNPRYAKKPYEVLKGNKSKKGGLTFFGVYYPNLSWLLRKIKTTFVENPDDYDKGLGFNNENLLTFVRADIHDEEISRIPVAGLSKLKIDEVSNDFLFNMHRYWFSTERQKKLIEINPIAVAIRDTLNENKLIDPTKANKRKFLQNGVTEYLFKKGKNIRSATFNSLYDREFLGEELADFSKDMHGLHKFTGLLMGMASHSFFALNIPSGVKNMLGGMFQNAIETSGGQYVNAKSLAKGTYWAQKALMSLQDDITKLGPKSLNTQLSELLDFVPGRFQHNYGKSTSRNIIEDSINLSWFTSPRKFMELESQFQLAAGIYYNVKVKQTQANGTVTEIPYMEAWELKDGQINLKEGIDNSWAPGGSNFNLWKNRAQEKARQLFGTYDKFSQPEAQRYLLFRLFSYMRRYFTSMLINRWGKNRYNWSLTDLHEGFYTTSMKFIKEALLSKGQNFKYMTDTEKIAVRKLGTELFMLVALNYIALLAFGWDPDDEDRYKKLNDKSGDMLSEDFKLNGWLANHALNQVIQVRNENEAFVPFPGFGFQDYLQMKNVTSIAFAPTTDNWAKLATDVYHTAHGDDSAYYAHDSGPLSWQKEGSNKFWNHLGKIFGVTGSTIDPVGRGIKPLAQIKAMQGDPL